VDEIAALLETQIPALRRYARALLRNDGRLRFDRLLLLAHRRDDLREHQQTVARLVFAWLTGVVRATAIRSGTT
jgi:hypothetical protein